MSEQLQAPSGYKSFVYSTLVHLQFMNSHMDLAQKAADGAIWYAYRTTDRRIRGIAWFRKGWMQDITLVLIGMYGISDKLLQRRGSRVCFSLKIV